jgi:hypothetical protein
MLDRATPAPVLAATASVAGAAVVLLVLGVDLGAAAVALIIGIGALVPVRVTGGRSLPVSVAPAIATIALRPHLDAAAILVVASVVSAVLLAAQRPVVDVGLTIARTAVGTGAALGAVALADRLAGSPLAPLAASVVASAALVVGDLVAARVLAGRSRLDLQALLPVHLTLACAGILVAVAVDAVGVAMAGVAAFPLLITRVSFERHADATDTLAQTVQALGLVPELAGIAPLGHSERAAVYATALARQLRLDRAATTRVVTATRLHHIGAVPFDAEDGPGSVDASAAEIAAQGARILRDAGLAADIADLLEVASADVLDATAPSIEAAVVRIASIFDELVGDDITAADRGLALVSASARDPHTRRVTAALLELASRGDELVIDSIAAGDRFREAAVGLDLETVTSSRNGADLLPFVRKM